MAFDFKKEYKEFYLPPAKPQLVTLPAMNFVAVRGSGDPNEAGGAYQRALGLLYGLTFTLKMSPKAGYKMEGFFEYALPPLEGLWWQEGVAGVDYSDNAGFNWISMIRLPDFVSREDFAWAKGEAERKKKSDFSAAEFFTYEEGLCVQCLHIGDYDAEPATVRLMHEFAAQQGYVPDMENGRLHHEIYLSDARRVARDKLRTVVRHPICKG